ncbi:transposase, partial [Actinacidiphila soli]|uniref:transposase n=1 Tax=Actinacidiphila soli TaxID=2487275 RepID=UPI001F0C9AF3
GVVVLAMLGGSPVSPTKGNPTSRASQPRLSERVDVGDASTFATSGHLAAYAGLAPASRISGSSIRGEQPSRRGNKQLKRAFFLAAFASLADPASRTYYDRKRTQGKTHTQALLCLARRRVDVLFAMLRDGTFYESRPASAA